MELDDARIHASGPTMLPDGSMYGPLRCDVVSRALSSSQSTCMVMHTKRSPRTADALIIAWCAVSHIFAALGEAAARSLQFGWVTQPTSLACTPCSLLSTGAVSCLSSSIYRD